MEMEVLKAAFFLSLFFPSLYAAANDCQISTCGNNGFRIRFPFWLSPLTPQTCGYAGFDIRCNTTGNNALLNFPASGDFLVSSINYQTQVMTLKDPYKCLAKRLQELNLSGSPFKAAYYQNYTFLSCRPDFAARFTPIDCLTNSTTTTLATSSVNLANVLTMCKKIGTWAIPVSQPPQSDDGFTSDLNDVELTWSIPNCDTCEGNGGFCTLKNSTSKETVCSYVTRTGNGGFCIFKNSSTSKETACSHNTRTDSKSIQLVKIMALCIAVLIILSSLGIATFVCCMDRRPNVRVQNLTIAAPELAGPHEAETISTGLDEITIESYAKVIVGESRRLPGPNHITCPICLSEYHAKDTLRCIPECQHCFHSDCIDEWLRLKGTCPVCRNSPSPAHVHS